jgi:signal transduction histidine kinase
MKKPKIMDFNRYYPIFFTILFVLIIFQYSFPTLEAIFYDLRVKNDLGIYSEDNFVIITMDEESDEFLGEKYPYTYASHQRLLKKLTVDNPLLINYFVSFVDPESSQDLNNLNLFKTEIKDYLNRGGAFRFGTDMDEWGEQKPPKILQELGFSLALINKDSVAFAKDEVSRRAILNISGEDSLHLWAANKFRKHNQQEELDLNTIRGAYYVAEADATFSLIRFATSPAETNKKMTRIPFHRVVVGNFPKDFFKNKIVLIGSSYISNPNDYLLTPFNKELKIAPKLFVHANIIEALIKNKTVWQIPINFSYALSFAIAIFLSLVISKVKPTHGLLITVGTMLGMCLISYLIFCLFGYWLYVTHIILTIFVVYYIWVPFRAIGEYQRRYAIQEETKLLKQVESLKQNFISLMSHDLKTPVAKIAGLADIMLQQNKSNFDIAKNLKSIIDSTRELNNFITSILDLTKVESNKLHLDITSKDINDIVLQVVEQLKFEAGEKSVTVDCNLSPLYPIKIDVKLFQRVISNIIENAIKYSGKGSKISIKTWDDENWVSIEISDNGVGIPEDDLEHIFDKFYRVKNDASHSIKGSGLGLFLVKYFVELLGGTIEASSIIGQGTTFKIQLKNA